MTRILKCALCLLCLSVMAGTAIRSQTDEAPERRVDLSEVKSLRAQVEGNEALDEEVRARLLELYAGAISALEAAAVARDSAADADREEASLERRVSALRAELARPEQMPRLNLPSAATVEQTEGMLERERSRLQAHRSALRELERIAEERIANRNEWSRHLGTLDQQLETLNDELRTATAAESNPEIQRALRNNLLARRQAVEADRDRLRAQLRLLDASGGLVPLQTDQAQRRVEHSTELVALLSEATERLRHQEIATLLDGAIEQSDDAGSRAEALAPVADETEEMARLLWGPEGVVIGYERVVHRLSVTRKHISDLDRIVQLTRRKFEAFGYRGSLARWWPEVPDDFPEPGDIAQTIRRLDERIPEVQHQLIRFEQQRSGTQGLLNSTLDALREEGGGEIDPVLEQIARDQLALRRDLLDELILQYGRFSNKLVELNTVSGFFLGEIERITDFLYDRVLWVRSVPRPIVPQGPDLLAALGWMTSGANWSDLFSVLGHGIRDRFVGSLLFTGLIVLLTWSRRYLRRGLQLIGHRVKTDPKTPFGLTLIALVYTVLLALPMPLILLLGGWVLGQAETSTFVFAASEALRYTALVGGLLTLARELFAPHGLARVHFDWSPQLAHSIHTRLLLPEAIFLPIFFVALQLSFAGMRLSSPDVLQVYNNSLGRVMFIISMLVLGVAALGVFRPRFSGEIAKDDPHALAWNRVYMYAYPAILLSTLIPAVLALLGFYLTGYLLSYQMLGTLWILLPVLVLAGLLFRWRTIEAAQIEEPTEDEQIAERQVREICRFAVLLVGAVGLWTIWSEALPTLQIMKRIEIWPETRLVESVDEFLEAVPAAPEAAKAAAAEAETTATPSVPGVPAVSAPGEPALNQQRPLTLWHVFQALLTIAVTVMLVRNVPGLLQYTLRRRTALDAGARIALGTLIRYTLIIVGVSVAFGLLGVSWSKIQWLAAALTFGLGFGLQEIVANFVSGLILLMERPVRVGDAVTIGNLQGRVSRIQIRATTISLWDRSEMIVPNKEFITTKLVNWTLSDSKRRIDVPFRVAYGSNLDKVREVALAVARAHPEVLDDPPPQVLVLEFGNDAIKFELRVFVDFGKGLQTKDELHMTLQREFREHDIDFALPHLNIRTTGRNV